MNESNISSHRRAFSSVEHPKKKFEEDIQFNKDLFKKNNDRADKLKFLMGIEDQEAAHFKVLKNSHLLKESDFSEGTFEQLFMSFREHPKI